MTPHPGDTLIATRDNGEVRRNDIVTVANVSPSGEYLELDEHGPARQYRADAFLVVVKRPWWAWSDEEGWKRRATVTAEAFRDGLLAPACAAEMTCEGMTYRCNRTEPHELSHTHSAPDGEVLAWWCTCPECQGPEQLHPGAEAFRKGGLTP